MRIDITSGVIGAIMNEKIIVLEPESQSEKYQLDSIRNDLVAAGILSVDYASKGRTGCALALKTKENDDAGTGNSA